jgi:hypothetical protein
MASPKPTAWAVCLLIAAAPAAYGQQLNAQQIDLIKRTANDVCNTVREARGQQSSSQIEGEVRARLSGLSGRLVDLGGSGKGSVSQDEFEGLTRDATALALQGDRECRERLFNRMFDRLSDATPQPASGQASSGQVAVAPSGSNSAQQFKLDGGQTILLTANNVTFTAIGTPYRARGDLMGIRLDGRERYLSVGSSIDFPSGQGSCRITLLALIKERRGGDFLLKC